MNRLLLFLVFVLILVSCQNENDEPNIDSTAERTVLVWLAGDNNLSSEVPRKIAALAQGFANARLADTRLLIYSDRRNNYPQLIEVVEQGGLKILSTYPAHNSASPETLNRMLSEMMAKAPANSYGLIVFSHATGWLPQGALENPTDNKKQKSISRTIFDDNGEQMSVTDFAAALPCKFDYIVFENCFTAGVEVAYELRQKTERLLVSSAEILSPGFEEVYPKSLKYLLQPTPDLSGFAEAYFDYRNSQSGNNRSATVSVINTAALNNLAVALQGFYSFAPLEQNDIKDLQRFNRHQYTLFFDLEEAVERFSPERLSDVRTALDNVIEYAAATDNFIPGYSNGFTIYRHCGLTTYLPQSDFPILNDEYYKTLWYQAAE